MHREVPNFDGPVVGAGHESFAVRAEGHIVRTSEVPSEQRGFAAIAQLPYADRAVDSARRDVQPVRTEGYVMRCAAVPSENTLQPSGGEVPQLDALVAGHGQQSRVGTDRDAHVNPLVRLDLN